MSLWFPWTTIRLSVGALCQERLNTERHSSAHTTEKLEVHAELHTASTAFTARDQLELDRNFRPACSKSDTNVITKQQLVVQHYLINSGSI